MNELPPIDLPPGIRSSFAENVNGLRMHYLETGPDDGSRPLLLLLHGFPELAYSWRKVMVPLAERGYHVVAPDQRGFGRTTGWDDAYDQDLRPFNLLNLVRDAVALIRKLGYDKVEGVFGHDFGSPVAAYASLIRPDLFRSVALMSAPFAGPPVFTDNNASDGPSIFDDLGRLPRPRKHYHHYYSTRSANGEMMNAPQGLHGFLRGYFHGKSADWPGNDPKPLAAWTAEEIAPMPTYYIMDRDKDMAETSATFMPTPEEIASCHWLPEDELAFFAQEYGRTGFQGGLNWYRCRFEEEMTAELCLFGGRTIDIPACFIGGEKDWGIYQRPGALEAMRDAACTDMRSVNLVPGAGHWVQQEQPDAVVQILSGFLADIDGR